jgi:hypothetical protein
MNEVSVIVDELKQERGRKHYKDAAVPGDEERLREATERVLSASQDADRRERLFAFAFQTIMQGSFLDRQLFEVAVWKRFCRHDVNAKLRISYLAEEYEEVSDLSSQLEQLDLYPPLHISTSSFFDVLSKADLMLYIKEGTSTRSGVLFYADEEGEAITGERLAVETEIEENRSVFPFLFAVPDALRRVAEEELKGALLNELASCRWMWGRLQAGHEVPVRGTGEGA